MISILRIASTVCGKDLLFGYLDALLLARLIPGKTSGGTREGFGQSTLQVPIP